MEPRFRLKTHGDQEIELNVAYPIPADNGESICEWDWYVFTPPQLQIIEPRYTVARFFNNLQQYVRYAPYSLSLEAMVDGACDLSPLARIRTYLAPGKLTKDIDTKSVIYELRVMVNACHEHLGRSRDLIKTQVDADHAITAIAQPLEKLLDDITRFRIAVRELHPLFFEPRVAPLLREGFAWADETISLKTEKELFRLHAILAPREDASALCGRLLSMLEEERAHRMSHQYPSIVLPGRPDLAEQFIYRESMLKKWAQTAMYMTTEETRIIPRIVHAVAGFAAAAAMAFAVGATILTQQVYGQFTLPWAILVVIAYIFKDRLKEMIRQWMIAYVPKLVADDIRHLVDPLSGARVGSIKSRVRFTTPEELPEDIVRKRKLSHNPFHSILPQEDVIHFHKKLTLDCPRLMQCHKRLENVEEIVRLHLGSWFTKMDKPHNRISFIQDGSAGVITGTRVYHINVVLKLERLHPEPACVLEAYRVVLCREGILRVEPLS